MSKPVNALLASALLLCATWMPAATAESTENEAPAPAPGQEEPLSGPLDNNVLAKEQADFLHQNIGCDVTWAVIVVPQPIWNLSSNYGGKGPIAGLWRDPYNSEPLEPFAMLLRIVTAPENMCRTETLSSCSSDINAEMDEGVCALAVSAEVDYHSFCPVPFERAPWVNSGFEYRKIKERHVHDFIQFSDGGKPTFTQAYTQLEYYAFAMWSNGTRSGAPGIPYATATLEAAIKKCCKETYNEEEVYTYGLLSVISACALNIVAPPDDYAAQLVTTVGIAIPTPSNAAGEIGHYAKSGFPLVYKLTKLDTGDGPFPAVIWGVLP